MSRLYRELLETITAEIVAGDRQPGEMLPKETDLAEQFEVSRGVAREGIRALQERGLVDVKHGKGATVTPANRWDVLSPDVLGAALRSRRASGMIEAYLESRRILEVPAAEIAARRASAQQLDEVRAAHEAMRRAASRRSPRAEELFHATDQRFHQALARATHNAALAQMIERIHSAIYAAWSSELPLRERYARAIKEHQAILDAVVDGDPEAAGSAMQQHLEIRRP
ncbi:FadR/GntR family transcriptional regulator [Conexibacter stalactiti]|uniref:FadR/GntR family transcriptional regulator n=1 Tax=Conexibacter stalactiti TaxID=1940611 RepID=A0ABU4HRI9_9ACTN|nr:FadR/GntR family transcriptional regulator [Conexibacter stalactiti]MDW5595915.1 FadR/GntR family transcriptional regulator [Conexibacter stalactiti]MEC5036557.1 FadR/GntR family transcriptional regulator [Conexibacter stalactiti]